MLVSYMPLASMCANSLLPRAPTWGREFITRRELDSGRRALVDLGEAGDTGEQI